MAISDRNKSEVKKLSTYLEKEAIISKSFSHRTTSIVGIISAWQYKYAPIC